MALLLGFFTGGGFFTLLGKVLDFLKSPVGIVLLIAAFGFGCFTAGKWQAEKICASEKQESISRAKEIDLGASVNADEGLMSSLREANERALAAQIQLRDAEEENANRPQNIRDCLRPSDDEFGRLLGGKVRRAGKNASGR